MSGKLMMLHHILGKLYANSNAVFISCLQNKLVKQSKSCIQEYNI